MKKVINNSFIFLMLLQDIRDQEQLLGKSALITGQDLNFVKSSNLNDLKTFLKQAF